MGYTPKTAKRFRRMRRSAFCRNPNRFGSRFRSTSENPPFPSWKRGRRVLRGQLIARKEGSVSANVFSSVAGVVKGVVGHITASGKKRDHILVENDFTDESTSLPPLSSPTAESVLARIEEAGIVGMGGAGFPTHVKFNVNGKADIFVVNAAECEPYITCDYRILLEYAEELLRGVRYCMLACGAKSAVIGIEKNKRRRSPCFPLCVKKGTCACAHCARVTRRARKNS